MSSYMKHLTLSTPEERETLEVDVLFIGGGPASLAGAYRLAKLIEAHNERVSSGGKGEVMEPMIALIEKGQEIGSHSLSGAVVNPIALEELIPNYKESGCPIESPVTDDAFCMLTEHRVFKVPYVPPMMSNKGNLIMSEARFNRWLGGLVEQVGVNVFPGFAGVEILEENDFVTGVRTGDKGINASGERKGNFEPGIDLKAKVTVFGDGPRGYLSKELIRRHRLADGKVPQIFETGLKEVFEMPSGRTRPGTVVHTFGYPFPRDAVGGTWLYHMGNDLISVGLALPLDSKDPFIDQHRIFQQFKAHPYVRAQLEGGKPTQYGAKVISAGGYLSMPKLYMNGAIIVGEAASMVDMQRFKGIHLAMKSGMLAADRIYECLKLGDFSESALAAYEQSIRTSYVGKTLHRVRNFHRAMSEGLPKAFFHLGIQHLTGGRDILSHQSIESDYRATRTMNDFYGRALGAPSDPSYDGEYHLDKLADIYISGTMHGEDQPSHLKILDSTTCIDKCVEQYRYPCNRFCPAKVYEMLQNEESGGLKLRINFANCVHCQTCDIKCPLDNIRWTPPEGGQGPNYTLL